MSPECQLVGIIRGLLCTELRSTSILTIPYFARHAPFSVPLLAMVNMVLASICHPHDTGSSRHPRNTTYYSPTPIVTIQATYGHSSECLIDGSWKDILLSSLSDGCLAQCHGMVSFLITDLLYMSILRIERCAHFPFGYMYIT